MTDRLIQIFQRQKELSKEFKKIELRNRLGLWIAGRLPYSLDDPRFQYVVKDYAWRVIEELAEALDAETIEHRHEELADVFHFFVEFCLTVGFGHLDFFQYKDIKKDINRMAGIDMLHTLFAISFYHEKCDLPNAVTDFVRAFGMTLECLKNKPWKQSHTPTDKGKFYESLRISGLLLVTIFQVCGMSTDSLYKNYFKKADTNIERIKGGR